MTTPAVALAEIRGDRALDPGTVIGKLDMRTPICDEVTVEMRIGAAKTISTELDGVASHRAADDWVLGLCVVALAAAVVFAISVAAVWH